MVWFPILYVYTCKLNQLKKVQNYSKKNNFEKQVLFQTRRTKKNQVWH
jgi:hypothetical protein